MAAPDAVSCGGPVSLSGGSLVCGRSASRTSILDSPRTSLLMGMVSGEGDLEASDMLMSCDDPVSC